MWEKTDIVIYGCPISKMVTVIGHDIMAKVIERNCFLLRPHRKHLSGLITTVILMIKTCGSKLCDLNTFCV